jgi:hypothetical protein
MSNQLAFAMQQQQQTEWCWAAVSASVSRFFGAPAGPSGGPWQQCQVVNNEQNQTTCCQDGSTAACNVPWYLEKGLSCVGHLASPPTSGSASFAYVQGEVNGGRPVGVRIGWFGGGGHFVVLKGYDDSGTNQLVDVEDPWYGPSLVDYTAFATSYQGAGSWTDTYPVS